MRGDDIADRLRKFAVRVLQLTRELPKDSAGNHVARQLIRSATGGGANYEEARGAESQADFVHKVRVAAKEVRESHFWLKLIDEAAFLATHNVQAPIQEAKELLAILTSSARTAKG